MAECVSCGLLLGASVSPCPGCGADQTPAPASAVEARCARHADVVARETCSRCGRFMCLACADADSHVRSCLDCGPALATALEARIAALGRKANLVAMVQAAVVVGLTALTGDRALLGWMSVLGAATVLFGAWGLVRGHLSVASQVPCWVMALLALWASASSPPMLVGVGLALLHARWVWQIGPLERNAWALRRRHARG